MYLDSLFLKMEISCCIITSGRIYRPVWNETLPVMNKVVLRRVDGM
jgi:hypothetical protein